MHSNNNNIYSRRRVASSLEIDSIPWIQLLSHSEQGRVVSDLKVSEVEAGEFICRTGKTANYWFGIIHGLVKMSAENAEGQNITFTGIAPGGWFGEGTLLKKEPYRYDIQALRKSTVAGLHIDTFTWLLDNSIRFNRFVMNQLNERLGQFIEAREIDRLNNPDNRVARSLASLFNSVLYPKVGSVLRITQQELAYLVGLSRQRVNESLNALSNRGVVRIEYGGLRVINLDQLRSEVLNPAEMIKVK